MKDDAGVYTRISDDRESDELGVTRQDQDGCDLATRVGLNVARKYSDNDVGASNRSRNKPRPGYEALLADAEAGLIRTIVAYSSSRLTRRPLELERQIQLAEKCGVRFIYVRSPSFDLNTADGRQIARILAAADAAESERIGERVARQVRQRAESGGNHGGRRPYGFLGDGVTVDEAEAAEVRRMADQVLTGVPLAAISRGLNEREVPTVTGNRWTPETVKDILAKPRCAGIIVHLGEEAARLAGDPILSEDTWRAVLDRMNTPLVEWTDANGNRRTATRQHNTVRSPRWLGTGIYRCFCGAPMAILGGTKRPPAYVCSLRRRPTGIHTRRTAVKLDEYVATVVVDRLSRPDAAGLVVVVPAGVDANALRVEVATLRQRKIDLATAFAEGEIDKPALRAGTQRVDDKLVTIEQKLAISTTRSPLTPLIRTDDVVAAWEGLTLGERRGVVRELTTVTILPARRGSGFDPEAIKIEWR